MPDAGRLTPELILHRKLQTYIAVLNCRDTIEEIKYIITFHGIHRIIGIYCTDLLQQQKAKDSTYIRHHRLS